MPTEAGARTTREMFQICFVHAVPSREKTEHYTSYAWLALGGAVVPRDDNGTTSCLGPKTMQAWRGKYLLEEKSKKMIFQGLYMFWSGVSRQLESLLSPLGRTLGTRTTSNPPIQRRLSIWLSTYPAERSPQIFKRTIAHPTGITGLSQCLET